MLNQLVKTIVGSKNDREVKKLRRAVQQINALEDSIAQFTDEQFPEKTAELKSKIADGTDIAKVLPEAFAVCREASKRVMGMRHFDVQLIGGMVLNSGKVAEMKTGEGKTLVATLAVYLNALVGKGVHVVTVNDYLAKRDAEWMRPLYEFLGLSVGFVVSQQPAEEKRQAYQSDITYGTNNEFGFDYLRDNMAFNGDDRMQRGHAFAVVDEVDSILIDEARTPLIISGPAEDSSALYEQVNKLMPNLTREIPEQEGVELVPGDYTVDEKQRTIELTESGHEKVEGLLREAGLLPEGESLYAGSNLQLLHHVNAAIRAHSLFQRNVDYLVKGSEVIIVDEHTGRTMPGRRWGDGLHQAIEVKEGLKPQRENQTLASTTFQNYFRLYDKLSGMTGTADTEAYELNQIYGLDVVVIPTNKGIARKDFNDLVYANEDDKYAAVIEDVKAMVEAGRPILVGTASVEASERLSEALKQAKVKHNVLNAKQHASEADVIAQAGRAGAVTIATNMAGRGTDIVLGGKFEADLAKLGENPSDEQVAQAKAEWQERHDAVIAAGGLHIVGTERHESRRIDNQLRGRAGRQGDPGSSRFYLSLDDPLMRIFMGDNIRKMMESMGMKSGGEPIEAKMVSKAVERAQRKVENRNFDIRKQLLEYDDVANDQRTVVYAQRNEIMDAEEVQDLVKSIRRAVVTDVVSGYVPEQSVFEQWDLEGLQTACQEQLGTEIPAQQWFEEDKQYSHERFVDRITEVLEQIYTEKEGVVGAESIRRFEKQITLQVLDQHWKEHLYAMDFLRQGIHFRGYAQKNPKQEYKREAFELFQQMLQQIRQDTIKVLSSVKVRTAEEVQEEERRKREQVARQMRFQHEQAKGLEDSPAASAESEQEEKPKTVRRDMPKVGRNDPCPCGSGKKFKQCHGKLN